MNRAELDPLQRQKYFDVAGELVRTQGDNGPRIETESEGFKISASYSTGDSFDQYVSVNMKKKEPDGTRWNWGGTLYFRDGKIRASIGEHAYLKGLRLELSHNEIPVGLFPTDILVKNVRYEIPEENMPLVIESLLNFAQQTIKSTSSQKE